MKNVARRAMVTETAVPEKLTEGAAAPSFSLPADDGTVISLETFQGAPFVLYFYPKDDTPGCTREAQAFQQLLPQVQQVGARIVGVSRDSGVRHQAFKTKYDLTFPLLSDPDARVHQAYGAWGTKKLYGKETTGVLRTTILVNGEGKIAKIFGNVRVDGHGEKVLAALAKL